MKYDKERQAAISAAGKAGMLCSRIQTEMLGDATIYKGDKSPVTVADFSVQSVICKEINEAFPDDSIVGEEDSAVLRSAGNEGLLEKVGDYVGGLMSGASAEDACKWIDLGGGEAGGRFWTLDPIDGTKGFIRGDQYAVALALIEDGDIKLGVLACPNLPYEDLNGKSGKGLLFVAVRGEGAEMLPLEGGEGEKITVSSVSNPSEARMVEGVEKAHGDHSGQSAAAKKVGFLRESVRMDSQAKYAVVAKGGAELYLRMPSPKTPDYRECIWDHAAGLIVVEEAGGMVTDINGTKLDFTKGKKLFDNRGVVVSNGLLHDQIVKVIRKN